MGSFSGIVRAEEAIDHYQAAIKKANRITDKTEKENYLKTIIINAETEAKAWLGTIGAASSLYAATSSHCPSTIEDLVKAVPPYLAEKPYSQGIDGYRYAVGTTSQGCKVTAEPIECGKSGSKVFIWESGNATITTENCR